MRLEPGEVGGFFPVGGGGFEGGEFLGFEGEEEADEVGGEESGEGFAFLEAVEGLAEGGGKGMGAGAFVVGVVGDGGRWLETVLNAEEAGGEGDSGEEVGVSLAGDEAIFEAKGGSTSLTTRGGRVTDDAEGDGAIFDAPGGGEGEGAAGVDAFIGVDGGEIEGAGVGEK